MTNASNLLLLTVLVSSSVLHVISANNLYRRHESIIESDDNEQQKSKTSQLVNENLHRSSLLQDAVLSNLKTVHTQLEGSLSRRRRDSDDSNAGHNNEKNEKSLFDRAGEALRQSIARAYQLWDTVRSRVKKTYDSITGNN